jgi:adenine-specific DNA-methyltransferase
VQERGSEMKSTSSTKQQWSGAPVEREHLLERVELFRLDAARGLEQGRRGDLGQFMTPAPVARLLAGMFRAEGARLRLLDPGAGVGSLTAAWVAEVCGRDQRPREIEVVVYEIDPHLASYLATSLKLCEQVCKGLGVKFSAHLLQRDFIESAVDLTRDDLFAARVEPFDCVIMNPPYRKIGTASKERLLLEAIGAGTTNLYTAFLSLGARLLRSGGEMVAITPRSFCNGTYFRPFRKEFLDAMGLLQLHVFESRDRAFGDDDVLQENVIFHAIRSRQSKVVTVWASTSADSDDTTVRDVPYAKVVRPDDPELFIRLATDAVADQIADRMGALRCSLEDLGIAVSTGRVVDFRAREYLRAAPGSGTAPLIYPGHLTNGFVRWPKVFKKPNAIVDTAATADLLVPSDTYVLVKRFSSKEEPRRVVAAVFDPTHVPGDRVGFENHLNYFHENGRGLRPSLARGLAVFLNSTLVDEFFRQLSGHTQVNAGDLRNLRYPGAAELEALGARVQGVFPSQDEVDSLIDEVLFPMAKDTSFDPVRVKARVEQALGVLKDVGMPREQCNERSALTLLALLDLKPNTPWSKAKAPLRGITPMMEFFKEFYGKEYAPNSRETVRRQTVHQFLDAGLIVANPDQPDRPTNSGKNVYQIEASALELMRAYGTKQWPEKLKRYLAVVKPLKERYAREREMQLLPVAIAEGKTISLTRRRPERADQEDHR